MWLYPYLLKIYINLIKIKQIRLEYYLVTIYYSFVEYGFNNIITFLPIHLVRISYLKYILKIKIGIKTFIHMGVRFDRKVQIGQNSVIGRNCILHGDILIGNNVSITAETYIFSSSHIVNDPYFNCFYKRVIIEDFVWIGARAMILPGVILSKGSVVGANSTVTKNVEEYSIVIGSPAREVSKRCSNLLYNLNYFPFFQ
jgi:maltose O-acetyltransferase